MRKKIAHVDIHRCFTNVYEDQAVDVVTERQWLVCLAVAIVV
jgi:hypothetical protein